MKSKLAEILGELKSVLSGRTFDAILPPLLYGLLNGKFGLTLAAVAAGGVAFAFFLYRLAKRQNWAYALVGLAGVALATGLALITREASAYYLPGILYSALLVLLLIISLVVSKPLAAWASHLARGWPLAWFWLPSIRPAYLEVTIFWLVFFLARLVIQISLYQQGQTVSLAWANMLLGWPVTIVVLVLSYVYGIWRLRKLRGPGVDEFITGKQPPYRGQTRGF